MELSPAHPSLPDDDTDEDLSDEEIRRLLNEAAQRMQAKAASQPAATAGATFRLPKLRPGHIADTHESSDGNITRLDESKLVDRSQQTLANGVKKIDDPLHVMKQKKQEVSTIDTCIACILHQAGSGRFAKLSLAASKVLQAALQSHLDYEFYALRRVEATSRSQRSCL